MWAVISPYRNSEAMKAVEIVEVAPRDGLQDESTVVPTQAKIELVERALATGVRRVEAVSFVHPERVPTMADAEAVMAGVKRCPGTRLAGLVLNEHGLDRALAAAVDEINVVVLVTDAFSRRNQGMTTGQALTMWSQVAARAADAGVAATVTLGAAFGCPYEGVVDRAWVGEVAERVAESGPSEIALADTIGAAVPHEVDALVREVGSRSGLPVRVHLHNSRNTGFANALAAVMAGAHTIDASLGGIGGCPFAPGASGNIATEDVVYLLERSGFETGLQLDGLIEASRWLAGVLGRDLPGQLARTGPFPLAPAAA
jgi:hydroxymethylglutaryl-CoA lyase